MKIKLDGNYQTISGLNAKIYSTEDNMRNLVHGAVKTTGGRWECYQWSSEGVCTPSSMSLMDAPLFDSSQIPWSVLRDEILFIALDEDDTWYGHRVDPLLEGDNWYSAGVYDLEAIKMPNVDPAHWRETLVGRPKE